MKLIRNCFLIVAFTITGIRASSQKVNLFSAEQTIDYAMKNAVAVQNALLDIQIQKQTNREVTAMAYPRLNTSLVFNDFLQLPTSLIPAEFTGGAPGTFIPLRFGTKYNVTGAIDFDQILFDGQVFVGLQARKATLDFSSRQAEVTMEMIRVNIYKLYYQILVGHQQMQSIDANIDRFSSLLEETREIYKNGFAEKLDVDKVSVQLSNLQTEKIRVQSLLDAANAGLKFLINMPQADSLALTDSLREDRLKDLLIGEKVNYSAIREYQLYESGYKLAGYNVRRYKLAAYPTFSFFATYNRNAQRTSFDFFKQGSTWYPTGLIGFRMQFNIFNGNMRQAQLQRAILEEEKMENNLSQIKESIDNNVAQATFRINASIATLETQRKNMQLAEQVYYSTKLKYEQGLGSQQEIYAAQAELKVAQSNYYGALYDAVVAGVDYRKAIGKI